MVARRKRDFRSTCLWGTLLIGFCSIAWGMTLSSVLPCDVTQSALTPEEQADTAFRARVIEILGEAAFYEELQWYFAGGALMAVSAFGLWTAPKEPKTPPEAAESPAS